MTVAPDRVTDLEIIRLTLQTAHRNRVRDLTFTANEDGIDLDGAAVDSHAIQLVIRDVLAVGVRFRRNHIRVRSAASDDRTSMSESQSAHRLAEHPSPRVVLACSDGRLSAEVGGQLLASGFAVELAPDGVTSIASSCRHVPQVLAILGRLSWGGADGVIEVLTEAGRLDRTAVFYAGSEDGLSHPSPACRLRLAGVRFAADPNADDLLELLRSWRAADSIERPRSTSPGTTPSL